MTIKEKSKRIERHCDIYYQQHKTCEGCPLFIFDITERCFADPKFIDRNYKILFGEQVSNPYWERITQMSDRQREKGIKTYGQGLEEFTIPDAMKRIEYIQEELIDGLMYLEWLKEKLKGETENETD